MRVFVRFFHRLSCRYEKKVKNGKKNNREGALKKEVKKLPQTAEIENPAFQVLELSKRIFEKLKDVEDVVEIIAREVKRQLDRQK